MGKPKGRPSRLFWGNTNITVVLRVPFWARGEGVVLQYKYKNVRVPWTSCSVGKLNGRSLRQLQVIIQQSFPACSSCLGPEGYLDNIKTVK